MVLALLLLLGGGPLWASAIRLRDVAAAWGIDFRHHNGATGRRYMVETMMGGLVVFDYDGDGDEDVFFVDGGTLPGYDGEPPRSRLFRNDGPGRFVDSTARSRIVVTGYGAGAAAGDVDGDGDLDLYVTAMGTSQLFRNEGDGTFRDVTAAAGVGVSGWSAGAAFADVDGDGDLDLYVARYADFTVDKHRDCPDPVAGIVVYCKPRTYTGVPDLFFKNRGDGTFVEASAAAGLAGPALHGLGVGFFDLDRDGWQDLFVANDGDPNLLFHNRGNGTFEEIAVLAGTALSPNAVPEAGMGIDLDDYDGDGKLDVVVTNFELEGLALYQNLGDALFHDARYVAKLAEPSLLMLGFGADFADLDHDGDLDLLVANGHVNDLIGELRKGARFAQRNQVYENRGDGTFAEALDTGMDLARVQGDGTFAEALDTGMDLARVHRGLATGDLDGDRDLDVVVLATNDLAEVWENRSPAPGGSSEQGSRSLLVDLLGSGGNTFAVGGRITVEAAGRSQLREVRTGTSYLSQNAMSAHFGVAGAERVDRLSVRWPDGRAQSFRQLPARHRVRIVAPP